MKKISLCVVIMMTLSLIVSCSAKKEGKTLVKIGPTEITEGDLQVISSINPRLKAQMASEFGKKKILDNLVEQELFYQAAKGEGLQNDPDVKEKIDIYKKVIISQAYLDKKLKEKAKAYYKEH